MSKTKSITEQIEELQQENDRLKSLEKLLNAAVKMRFGLSLKEIDSALKKKAKVSRFEQDLCRYFSLKSDEDKDIFQTIICSEATRNYYHKKLTEYASDEADSVPVETQG